TEPNRGKCSLVRGERPFVLGATVDVVEHPTRQPPLGHATEVLDRRRPRQPSFDAVPLAGTEPDDRPESPVQPHSRTYSRNWDSIAAVATLRARVCPSPRSADQDCRSRRSTSDTERAHRTSPHEGLQARPSGTSACRCRPDGDVLGMRQNAHRRAGPRVTVARCSRSGQRAYSTVSVWLTPRPCWWMGTGSRRLVSRFPLRRG